MTTRPKAKSPPACSGPARSDAAHGHKPEQPGAPTRGPGAQAAARGGTSARRSSGSNVGLPGRPAGGPKQPSWETSGAPSRELLRIYQAYQLAARRSRAAGRPVSVRFVVDPSGVATVPDEGRLGAEVRPRVDEPSTGGGERYSVEVPAEPDAALRAALDAARARGQGCAAEILAGADMLSAEQFAALIGTSRVTVNTRRQRQEVLALDGAKRGFRFPAWQVDREGRPFAAIPALFDRLGGSPWAVYRFLVQPHPELDGRTGRGALERGASAQAVEAAESVARDFR